MKYSTKEKEKEARKSAWMQKKESEQTSAVMAPPEFSPTTTAAQLKGKGEVMDVPEKTGKAQEGPLAIKGAGDAQAMDASDINQGSIGNCFFLASLGAVAHSNPDVLKNAIKDNKDGTYTVSLYSRWHKKVGKERPDQSSWGITKLKKRSITVNAEFPTMVNGIDTANNTGSLSLIPPHAHGGDQDSKGQTELWVRVIEKAYAVMNGGYDNIGNGGYTEHAFEALTGKQYSEKVFRKVEKIKKKLISASEKGQPSAVSTKSQGEIDGQAADMVAFADANDIVGGHAYSVLEANDKGIKIRNPWGKNAANTTPTLTWEQFDAFFNQTGTQN